MMNPHSPLLSQFEDNDPAKFCNSSTINGTECMQDKCACLHYENVGLNKVVDLVFINMGEAPLHFGHPMHLHGSHFRVMAQGEVSTHLQINEFPLNSFLQITLMNPHSPLKFEHFTSNLHIST